MAEEAVEEPGSTPENVEVPAPEGTAPEQAKPEKTFTQAELDKKVQERIAKEQRKYERLLAQKDAEVLQAKTPPPVAPESKPVRREDFDSYEDYLEARAVEKATRAAERHMETITAAQRKQAVEWAEQHQAREMEDQVKSLKSAGQAKYSDFDEVVSQDVPLNRVMVDAILHSDNREDLAYYFGKNPDEAQSIANLPDTLAAIAIGKLSAALESKGTKSNKVSSAPPPISTGTGKTPSTSSLPQDSDDVETWMRKERERVRNLRR